LAPFLGRFVLPFSDVVVYPRHVPPEVQKKLYAQLISSVGRGVLTQLEEWILQNAFRSLDLRIDYRAGIQRIEHPLLFIAGSRDRSTAPFVAGSACELARSSDKTLRIFGREYGEAQEYGHGDLIFGERAPAEVFPFIAGWLASRATPLDVDQPPPRGEAGSP